MYKLFDAITTSTATASRRKEMDLRSRTDLRQLLLVHYIQDPTTGGFLNYAFQEMTTQEALFSVEGKTVTTASRDGAGTVTVTCTGHGLEPGDLAVLTGVVYAGAVDFNGSYPVVTTADANTFTYTQIGAADATGAGGRAHRVKRVAFVPEGYNVKSSAQAAGYISRLGNLPNAVMEFIVSPTDGTHTIYVDELCGGASGSESRAVSQIWLGRNSTQADQRLTVDATAGGKQFSAFHTDTTHVLVTAEDAQVRFTLDGSAPTSINGHILEPGDSFVWHVSMTSAAKFIRTTGVSGILHASQLKAVLT